MDISSFYMRRRRAPQVHSQWQSAAVDMRTEKPQEEAPVANAPLDDALLARDRHGRQAVAPSHRIYHRRQLPNVVTVVVDVIATVDTAGNILAQQTEPPALPSVPAVPTPILPSVPAVPPFPSDLTVPAVPPYPWPSGVPTRVDLSSAPTITQSPVSATASTSVPASASSALSSASVSTMLSGVSSSFANSTSSSSVISTSLVSTLISTSSTSSSPSLSPSSTSSAPSTVTSLSSTASVSSATSQTGTSTVPPGGGGRVIQTSPAPAPAPGPSTPPAAGHGSGSGSTTPTTTVVGSVVGGLAGFALILALILFLIRRHKQKRVGGALQLRDDNEAVGNQPAVSPAQQMATRSSAVPLGAAAFLHRFSGASKSTTASSPTGEKSFQRISGRKLPSAFSEGMTSEQFAREGTLSGSSFYRDDQELYGASAAGPSKEFGKEVGLPSGAPGTGTTERYMPGPARTPVIHHPEDAPPWGASHNGGQSTLSPPHTPNAPLAPHSTLGRSHPSHDGSRSSRFTEDV